MEKKIISFKGISNVPDDGFNEAGDMSVLLNMRHKGGELVPCREPAVSPGFVDTKQALYHANSGLWLFLNEEGRLHYFKDNNYGDGANDIGASGVESFAIMGNIVIMNFADRVEYAIWKNGGYSYLGEKPDVFGVTMKVTSKVVAVKTESSYNNSDWQKANIGFIDECIAKLNKDGYYIDRALFRVGFRLFDGSYISASNIIYVSDDTQIQNVSYPGMINKEEVIVKRDSGNLGYTKVTAEETSQYIAYARGFRPDFTINASGLEAWEDIIVAIDIFSTTSIMGKKVGLPDRAIAEMYVDKSIDEIAKEVADDASFFLIATYDIDGTLVKRLENVSPSNLAVQDFFSRIREDSFTPVFVKSNSYNNKLHIYKGKEFFFDGYGLDAYIPVFGSAEKQNVKMLVRTKVNDNGQDVYVNRLFQSADLGYRDGFIQLPAMLTYPNAKALEMEIFIQRDTEMYSRAFPMKAHPFLDFSYYLNMEDANLTVNVTADFKNGGGPASSISATDAYDIFGGAGTYEVIYSSDKSNWTYNGDTIPTSWKKYRVFAVHRNAVNGDKLIFVISGNRGSKDICNIKVDGLWTKEGNFPETVPTPYRESNNILKVSAVDNPFYFPMAQTYKFEGEIVGLASNAEAISTGQFGQYPLFVFTDTGIWAMQVDTSGKGAYSFQSPFSREVCSGAICPVSGGVVFATEKGVMAISGGQVSDLSAALDGFEVDFFHYNAEMWNAIFAKAGKGVVNPVPIREYIEEAVIAYNYLYNEIILSNKAKGYSYVYSLTNKVWSVIDTVFDLTTNKYPELVVFDKQGKMITFADGESRAVPVVAITRPYALGSFDFKRLRQAGLRTTFEGSLNFYLLGSNDGAEFKCITGKEYPSKNGSEPTNVTRRDLITAMSRSKQYKYFAIAIAGQMSGRVSMAELLVDAGFANNKIR